MSLRFAIPVLAGLVCGLAVPTPSSDVHAADEAPGSAAVAAPAADGHSAAGHGTGEAHDPHAAGEHHPDYNKAPLPGSAPGLGTLFVFSLLLFGAFVLVARTMIWAPLIAALDRREARVSQAHAEAEAAKAQAEQLLAQHSARMAQVHEQVQGIIAQTRKEAEQEKNRIIAEAEAQAKSLRDRAVAEIHQARDSALEKLEGNLDAQVSRAVQQVVGAV
jgi:F-type H+-transporting ATPase subunit b